MQVNFRFCHDSGISFSKKSRNNGCTAKKYVFARTNNTYNFYMYDDIENIQSEINKLNQLCEDSLSSIFESEPANPKARRWQRLGVFILKLLDGVLERRYVLRLEKWLRADADARRYYIDFMHLTALLHMHYNPEDSKAARLVESLKP